MPCYQETRNVPGYATSNSYTSVVLFKLPACIHNSIKARLAWTNSYYYTRLTNVGVLQFKKAIDIALFISSGIDRECHFSFCSRLHAASERLWLNWKNRLSWENLQSASFFGPVVHWAPSQTTRFLVLAGARRCALETCGKKKCELRF